MESVNLSFFRSALHTAHDLIHICCSINSRTELDFQFVVWDAAGLSLNCQTNIFATVSQANDALLFYFGSSNQRARQYRPHSHCVNRSETVSPTEEL
jgi:hypothetical protein